MEFTIEDMRKLAALSRLELSDEELLSRKHDLEDTIGYVKLLQEANIEGVEPMTHAVPMTITMRPDEIESVIGREALKTSEGYEDGLVKVPAIIE